VTDGLGIYVAASLALILTPGQDMLYVISRSLAQGRAAGVYSAIGVILGILVHTALAAFGVGAILAASEGLFLLLKLVGAAYLLYLGLRLMFSRTQDVGLATGGNAMGPRASSGRVCFPTSRIRRSSSSSSRSSRSSSIPRARIRPAT
jgi:threonine/homoserine/homoserine lactone efflux protein